MELGQEDVSGLRRSARKRKGLYVRVMVFLGGGTEEVFLSAGDSMGATGVCVGC